MKTTYEKIYHAIKEADYFQPKTMQIGGQVFTITCEKDASIIRFTLDYFDNEKIIHLNTRICFVNNLTTEKTIKRITRAFFRDVMYRCIYDIRIYRSERRISRSDLEKCYINCYDHNDVFVCHEFCGWRKRTYLTW